MTTKKATQKSIETQKKAYDRIQSGYYTGKKIPDGVIRQAAAWIKNKPLYKPKKPTKKPKKPTKKPKKPTKKPTKPITPRKPRKLKDNFKKKVKTSWNKERGLSVVTGTLNRTHYLTEIDYTTTKNPSDDSTILVLNFSDSLKKLRDETGKRKKLTNRMQFYCRVDTDIGNFQNAIAVDSYIDVDTGLNVGTNLFNSLLKLSNSGIYLGYFFSCRFY